ncbi:MAG: hypothetical protein QW757_00065 [Candidatus Woesearchaeota archaeon]
MPKKKFYLSYFTIFLIILFFFHSSLVFSLETQNSFSEIIFSELMFNDNPEWLEYYSKGFFNLSNFKIKDNSQTDSIECCFSNCSFLVENEFFLIFSKNNETYLFLETNNLTKNQNIKFFCVDDSLIGNGLSNNNDEIILFNDNYKVNFSYDIQKDFFNQDIEKGKTLSFINDLNGFFITEPTPFEKNLLINSNEKNISFNNFSENISKNLI